VLPCLGLPKITAGRWLYMRHRETGIKAANKLSLLHLSLYQLSLRLWGITTPEKTTNRGYDLCSRGPPALDA
jgi:hypothetical protein